MPRAFLIKKKKCSYGYDVINDENEAGHKFNDENKEVFPKTKKRKSYEAMTRFHHKHQNYETKSVSEYEEKSENGPPSQHLISSASAPYEPHFLQQHLGQKLSKSEAALQHWMRPFLTPYLPIHFPYLYYAPAEVACPRAPSPPPRPNHLSPYAPPTKDFVSRGDKHTSALIEPALPANEASSNRLYSPITTLEELDTKSPVSERPKRSCEGARYQCPECHKSYSTYSGLSKHQQFHCAVVNKRTFSCKYCEKVYQSLGALKMHIRTHTLPCKCDLCGKAFSRPWLLQGHIRTHTGEKPFSCSHCDRAFADRSNLRAHLQTHSEVKKYSCKTCTKTFSRMSLLLKHEDGNCCNVNH